MEPEEVRAVGRLAGRAAAEVVTLVQSQHRAVASRVFRSFGPFRRLVRPVELTHDTIADAVYGVVRAVNQAVPSVAAEVFAPVAPLLPTVPVPGAGTRLKGVLNGAVGDHLAAHEPALAVRMAVRSGHHDVVLTPEQVAAAFPHAGSRIGVFVHGLCGTDDAWQAGGPFPSPPAPHLSFGDHLARDLDLTPVYVRYNSGLAVPRNGAELCRLLDDLVDAWPVHVSDLVLVGHSMGGLVLRSAAHQATLTGARWPALVSRAAYLGTPHLGAPLEKFAHLASVVMSGIPETRAFAVPLNGRSAGIKDLRHGTLVSGTTPGARQVGNYGPDPLRHARQVTLTVTLTTDRHHPLGLVLGDGLVRVPSGEGRHRDRPLAFEVDEPLGGLHHLDLLTHPEVYRRLRAALGTRAPEAEA